VADARVQELLRELRERYGMDLVPRPEPLALVAMRELASVPLVESQHRGPGGVPLPDSLKAHHERCRILENWLIGIGEPAGKPLRWGVRCGRVQGRARCEKEAGHMSVAVGGSGCSFHCPEPQTRCMKPLPGRAIPTHCEYKPGHDGPCDIDYDPSDPYDDGK
jgi:hypothetical protein